MKFYIRDGLECITNEIALPDFTQVDQIEFENKEIYYIYFDSEVEAQGIHIIEDPEFLIRHKETLKGKLSKFDSKNKYEELIRDNRLVGVNLSKVSFYDVKKERKKSYKINVLGLGDVGGIMLAGLRLLGGKTVSEIGIFDLDSNKIKRWTYELNQIRSIDRGPFPKVKGISFENIFDCDVFIFTASVAVPEVGSKVKDIRMYQLEGNAKIISIYAKKAKEDGFKGQFIVVSDPVDLLCKASLVYADGGLLPEQIKGFGLGVMQARASFYAEELEINSYEENGRAFGPHGKHLIIADNIINYNDEISRKLTEKTVKANLDIRECGYKPFIAPALSSAALSILAHLNGDYNYSTVYIDGVYFGCKNRSSQLGRTISEKYRLHKNLIDRLNTTYGELKAFEF